jgi:Cu/Ag efflux protein CusF
MARYLIAVLSILMLVAFCGVAFAAEAENPCAAKKNCGLEGISKVKGTVKSMDAEKGEVVLTAMDGKDITYKLEGKTGKGIKAGDKVEVTCMKKGEDCYAKKIRKLKASRGKKL